MAKKKHEAGKIFVKVMAAAFSFINGIGSVCNTYILPNAIIKFDVD